MSYHVSEKVIEKTHTVHQIGTDMVISGGTRRMTVRDFIQFAEDLKNSLAPKELVVEIRSEANDRFASSASVTWKSEDKAE